MKVLSGVYPVGSFTGTIDFDGVVHRPVLDAEQALLPGLGSG